MKASFLPLFFIGAAFLFLWPRIVLADTPTPVDSSSVGSNGAQGERAGRWKAAFAQLDLTEAQRTQIKQIRASVTERKERFEQIKAVLTPEQKEKLRQLIQENKNSAGTTPSSTETPSSGGQ